jgi:hypothetical protein
VAIDPLSSSTPQRVGEVIDAGTTEFTAQAYVLHEAPPFGGFVRASNGEHDVIAVVADAHTGSVDPGRRPIARGRDEADEEDIYRRNPELKELLRTEFRAVVVGHRDAAGDFRRWLPDRPPRLHAFVHQCAPAEIAEFTERLDFLPTLLGDGGGPVDELVAACLRQAHAARATGGAGDRAFLVAAGKELAVLLANEPNRLGAILRRIRP